MENTITFLVYVGTIYLVYRDSKKTYRSIGWTIGSVLVPFILPIIYFLTKPKKKIKPKKVPVLNSPKNIFTNVAGIMYKNDDGTDRQEILRRCQEGDEVELVREPNNMYDPNAVAVYVGNEQVGYLFREEASEVAPLLDAGYIADVTIYEIDMDKEGNIKRCHIEIYLS